MALRFTPFGIYSVANDMGFAAMQLAVTTGFGIALAVAGLIGFFISMTAVAAQISVQLASDPAMRSRVLSLWSLLIRVGPALVH